jgi:rSAM/selenodomain-associated transferase 1
VGLQKSGLIIFAKYPESAVVKTRLAKTTSNQFALDIYNICAANTFETGDKVKSSGIDILLFYSGSTESAFRTWIKKDFRFFRQNGRSLGDRLADAFARSFNIGYSKLAVIGTDVPDHSSVRLKNAFDALESEDIVIGPSPDGGYYLLGMKAFRPELFENIEWSSNKVYETTIDKITRLKMTLRVLPELYDLDDETDIKEWLRLPGTKTPVKSKIEQIYNKFRGSNDYRSEFAVD